MNYVRTTKFISTEARRISQPKIDKKKLKKLFNTDFASIASANLGGGGGLNLPGFDLVLVEVVVEEVVVLDVDHHPEEHNKDIEEDLEIEALLIEDLVDYHNSVEVEVFVFPEWVEYSVLQWQDLSMGEEYLKDKHKHRQ